MMSDTDLFGNWDPARLLIRGNPVLGGNMVTAHVYMIAPVIGPNTIVQIGVYDATVGVPAVWPLFATSVAFPVPAGAAAQWWVTPIVGFLVPGNSYAAALLGNNADPTSPSVRNDPIPNEYVMQNFIAPGVFPNPLGVGANATREWSLYITYLLKDEVSQYNSALCCACDNNC
ncbi:MAG: hypothetical protein KAV87_66315 [Desulfobacteraceae bacterium]|nr:hypothetical protein [Desulfobacteraceae bacterium]